MFQNHDFTDTILVTQTVHSECVCGRRKVGFMSDRAAGKLYRSVNGPKWRRSEAQWDWILSAGVWTEPTVAAMSLPVHSHSVDGPAGSQTVQSGTRRGEEWLWLPTLILRGSSPNRLLLQRHIIAVISWGHTHEELSAFKPSPPQEEASYSSQWPRSLVSACGLKTPYRVQLKMRMEDEFYIK